MSALEKPLVRSSPAARGPPVSGCPLHRPAGSLYPLSSLSPSLCHRGTIAGDTARLRG